jgi:predicted DNA-binding protein (MmcQ/YjbR family)
MAHPRNYDDSNPALKRLREICLAFPETFEKEAWGECTFRVIGGSMFAMTDSNHHGSGHFAAWVKAPPMVQEILVKSNGKRFFVPPYMGPKGWVGVRLDYKVNWDEAAAILKDGYLMSAPKRVAGRTPSAMDEVASMSNIAKKRRTNSISRVMPTANGKPKRRTATRSKKTPASLHDE